VNSNRFRTVTGQAATWSDQYLITVWLGVGIAPGAYAFADQTVLFPQCSPMPSFPEGLTGVGALLLAKPPVLPTPTNKLSRSATARSLYAQLSARCFRLSTARISCAHEPTYKPIAQGVQLFPSSVFTGRLRARGASRPRHTAAAVAVAVKPLAALSCDNGPAHAHMFIGFRNF
jgi:hypothetical protein